MNNPTHKDTHTSTQQMQRRTNKRILAHLVNVRMVNFGEKSDLFQKKEKKKTNQIEQINI